jgi:uncharacterized protein YuzE
MTGNLHSCITRPRACITRFQGIFGGKQRGMGRARNRVMKIIVYSLAVAGTLAFRGLAFADHDKTCKNIHGKVTAVTADSIVVNDKAYPIGDRTRITKDEKSVKRSQITAGDVVCVDIRGKDDIEGEVAAITVLSPSDPLPVREKEYVREKETVRKIAHDKNCHHVHGKVTRIDESTFVVDGKPYTCRETTKIVKGDQTVTIKNIKSGDFVCIDGNDDREVTTLTVLNAADTAPFESREVIRERERIREKR